MSQYQKIKNPDGSYLLFKGGASDFGVGIKAATQSVTFREQTGTDEPDYGEAVDTTLSKIITYYGAENDYPEKLRMIQGRSLEHSNIIDISGKAAAGEPTFREKDESKRKDNEQNRKRIADMRAAYEAANIFATHNERAYEMYAYGGSPTLLNFRPNKKAGLNGIFQVGQRTFPDFRLGRHRDTFFGPVCDFHYYCNDWNTLNGEGRAKTVLDPLKYFSATELEATDLLRVPVFNKDYDKSKLTKLGGMFSYLIAMPRKHNRYYPKASYDSETFWKYVLAEYELASQEYNTIKNGFQLSHIVTFYRSIYRDPEGTPASEAQKQRDLQETEQNMMGTANAGNVKVVFAGIYEEGARFAEGDMKVIHLPNNDNSAEITGRGDRISAKIRTAHSVVVPELLGLSGTKTGFSNPAEMLTKAAEVWYKNTIRPHQIPIERFYNEIVNPALGFEDMETIITPYLPTVTAMVELFKDYLTINEVREKVLGESPLEGGDDLPMQKAAINPNQANASISDKDIFRIAEQVTENLNQIVLK